MNISMENKHIVAALGGERMSMDPVGEMWPALYIGWYGKRFPFHPEIKGIQLSLRGRGAVDGEKRIEITHLKSKYYHRSVVKGV